MECNVCCEKLNASTCKRIDCGWCDFIACASCVQKFLLDLPDTPSCMNCKHKWDREFLVTKLTKTFMNGPLKVHREEVLFEVEKSLLPETQPHAEAMKQVYEFKDKKAVCAKALKELKKEYFNTPHNLLDPSLEMIEAEYVFNSQVAALKEEIKYYNKAMSYLKSNIDAPNAADATERRAFIKPCPADDCRGFLSSQWKCGLCQCKVCSKCHEIKSGTETETGEAHVCKPDNVATVEALTKDAKPCPKCGAMIQRIEGCSQMFHTPLSGGCGAVFDWNTLRLYTGAENTIHNPHWYEYQRHINNGNVPRQLGDMPCEGMPRLYDLDKAIDRLFGVKHNNELISKMKLKKLVDHIHRAYNHNQYMVLPYYTVNLVADNRDLRIEYLLNRIDEKKFRATIQKREKAREKKMKLGQVIHMHQTAVSDIMMRVSRAETQDEFNTTMAELQQLIPYTNECMEKVAKVYSCVYPEANAVTMLVYPPKEKKAKKPKATDDE